MSDKANKKRSMNREEIVSHWKEFTSNNKLELFQMEDEGFIRYLAKEERDNYLLYFEQVLNLETSGSHFKLSISAAPEILSDLYLKLKEMPIPFIPEEDDRLSVLISNTDNFLPKLGALRERLIKVLEN